MSLMEDYPVLKFVSPLFSLQDIRYLIADLLELKPTMFCGVPRVYDRIYTGNQV